MQLLVTGWMEQGQIGKRFIAPICYSHFVVQVPSGFAGDLLAAVRTEALLIEPDR